MREGKIPAQAAMKFLVPVARVCLEDSRRMAAIFAQQHSDTREAGQLYAAWRKGSAAIRKRILAEPELFFKAQRQAMKPAATATAAELLRDQEMVAAIVSRAQRRPARRRPSWTANNAKRPSRRSIALNDNSAAWRSESNRSQESMLSQAQRTTILELSQQGVSRREIARLLQVSRPAVRKVLRSNAAQVPELHRPEKAEPYRLQILELFSACKGNLVRVHGAKAKRS